MPISLIAILKVKVAQIIFPVLPTSVVNNFFHDRWISSNDKNNHEPQREYRWQVKRIQEIKNSLDTADINNNDSITEFHFLDDVMIQLLKWCEIWWKKHDLNYCIFNVRYSTSGCSGTLFKIRGAFEDKITSLTFIMVDLVSLFHLLRRDNLRRQFETLRRPHPPFAPFHV